MSIMREFGCTPEEFTAMSAEDSEAHFQEGVREGIRFAMQYVGKVNRLRRVYMDSHYRTDRGLFELWLKRKDAQESTYGPVGSRLTK